MGEYVWVFVATCAGVEETTEVLPVIRDCSFG